MIEDSVGLQKNKIDFRLMEEDGISASAGKPAKKGKRRG